MTTTTDPILDLDEDLPPQLWVRLGGEQHAFATLDDLGLNRRGELADAWKRVNELSERRPVTAAEEKEYLDRYGKMVRILLPSLKAAQVKALPIETKEALVQAFFSHRTVFKVSSRLTEMVEAMSGRGRPSETGNPSSPSSPGTTDEHPSEGATGETSP
ncbi:MAG: hypothetical protein M0R75_06880 [Dehalococcoidia bacterium]|nr:hypothetical protein [Dehalococcoidia bacterium]